MTIDQEFREAVIKSQASMEGKLDTALSELKGMHTTLYGTEGDGGVTDRSKENHRDISRWKGNLKVIYTAIVALFLWVIRAEFIK